MTGTGSSPEEREDVGVVGEIRLEKCPQSLWKPFIPRRTWGGEELWEGTEGSWESLFGFEELDLKFRKELQDDRGQLGHSPVRRPQG